MQPGKSVESGNLRSHCGAEIRSLPMQVRKVSGIRIKFRRPRGNPKGKDGSEPFHQHKFPPSPCYDPIWRGCCSAASLGEGFARLGRQHGVRSTSLSSTVICSSTWLVHPNWRCSLSQDAQSFCQTIRASQHPKSHARTVLGG